MLNKNSAFALLQDSLDSLVRSGTIKEPIMVNEAMQLLGPDSLLDSIGFVTFVTDIEDRMQELLGKECYFVLNDIAQFNINNPILTVDAFVCYMVKLAED